MCALQDEFSTSNRFWSQQLGNLCTTKPVLKDAPQVDMRDEVLRLRLITCKTVCKHEIYATYDRALKEKKEKPSKRLSDK